MGLNPNAAPTSANHRPLESRLFAGHHIVVYRVLERAADGAQNPESLRLDRFLKDRIGRRSREQIKAAIEAGRVTVKRSEKNSGSHMAVGRIRPSTQLMFDDEVHVVTERKAEPTVSFDYKVLYEDDSLLVITKPGNLPVHPAGRFFFHTLLIHLRTSGFTIPLEADREFFMVHRIDRETSGLMVIAKDGASAAHIQKQFAERETYKRYHALVHGWIDNDTFEVQLAMARRPDAAIRLQMFITPESEGGLPSQTGFKVVRRVENASGKFTHVECFPKTGRQHQIRVHLQSIGHPIVGDKLYSLSESQALQFFDHPLSTPTIRYIPAELQAKLLLERHALHAASLAFTHPKTNERMEFTSELPEDLEYFLNTGATAGASAGPTYLQCEGFDSD